jgi:hypothetical protein
MSPARPIVKRILGPFVGFGNAGLGEAPEVDLRNPVTPFGYDEGYLSR